MGIFTGILLGSYFEQNIGDNVDIFHQNKRKVISIVLFCRPCSCNWRFWRFCARRYADRSTNLVIFLYKSFIFRTDCLGPCGSPRVNVRNPWHTFVLQHWSKEYSGQISQKSAEFSYPCDSLTVSILVQKPSRKIATRANDSLGDYVASGNRRTPNVKYNGKEFCR